MLLVDSTHLFDSWRALHYWAVAVRPSRIHVAAQGVHREPLGFGWTVPCDLYVTGRFDGTGLDGRGPGWWLSYRVPHSLTLTDVTVSGYANGLDAGTDDGRRTQLVVRDSTFTDLGGGGAYAAVFTSYADVTVTGCRFRRVQQTPKPELLHAVYLTKQSHGTVTDCWFARVSGDPVRVRDGSSVTVTDCTNRRSGQTAVVSAWRQPTEAPSQMETARLDRGRTWDGKRKPLPQRTIR